MAGNVIRSVAKYLHDKGIVPKMQISIETVSGIKQVRLYAFGGVVRSARVNMGQELLTPSMIPVKLDGEKVIDRTTEDLKWEAGEGWMKSEGPLVGTSKESATFYYARPLNPGERVPLEATVFLNPDMDNEYQGMGFEVTAKATAVQFVSGQNELNAAGILNTFGVIASLDGSGNILSVTE